MEAPDDMRSLLERVMRERDELAARLDQIEGRRQRTQPEGNALDGIMRQLPAYEGKMQNAPAYMDSVPNPWDRPPPGPPRMQTLPGRMGPVPPLSERMDRGPARWDGPMPGFLRNQ